MDEITLYQQFMDLCIAHKNTTEWKQVHAFGVGYIDQLNTNNLEQSKFRKGLFYSEKWYEKGTNPNSMINDFPFVLMLPVTESSSVDKSGNISSHINYKVTIFILDLLYRDRNGVATTAYAKRSREQIWADTKQIGRELLKEYNRKYFKAGTAPKPFLANDGKYTADNVFEYLNGRFAGSVFEFEVILQHECVNGTFDYEKEFSERKEKFCQC